MEKQNCAIAAFRMENSSSQHQLSNPVTQREDLRRLSLMEEFLSVTYLASKHQRQSVVGAGNFAVAQQRRALWAFDYGRHSC